MKEGGCAAVKLETGTESVVPTVKAIVEAGIPVMGHLGLVPQSINALGGYRVQGRDPQDAENLLKLAQEIEAAGAFAIVLELIPGPLADRVTKALRIPVIGIGAGAGCDGQVIVQHDVLGITQHPPRFARKYMDGRAGVLRAFRKYARDVRERTFPGPAETIE